jgi:hypothetical protein
MVESITVEHQWNNTDGKTEVFRGKPAPLPLCPPEILHGQAWYWIWASKVKEWWLITWSMAQHLKWDGKIVMNVLWDHGRRQSQHVHGYRPSTCVNREVKCGQSPILVCPVFIQYFAVGCKRIIWYLAGTEIFSPTTITSRPTLWPACLLSAEHQQYQCIFLLGVK